MKESYFPILIIMNGQGHLNERRRVDKPEDLPPGRAFHVLETNYHRTDLKSYAQVAWEEDKADGTLDDK